MENPLLAALRFGLYAALLPLFGAPLFKLTTPWAPLPRRTVGIVAGTALILSALAIAATTAAMAGTSIGSVDWTLVWTLVTQTALGWAWIARIASLMLIAGWATRLPPAILAGLAAIALASLAWTGHGAAGEGAIGWVQMGADIIHLLAAGAWVGALVVLSAMLWTDGPDRHAKDALEDFARTGTIVVALILATGVVNGMILIGVSDPAAALATSYGQLLALKLLLFLVMLGLAALNRFRLTPALGANAPRSALRMSLAVETAAALAILGLVAWLGMLAPPALG